MRMNTGLIASLKLATARVAILGGFGWVLFTRAQLVMLPGEWMRDAWYAAGFVAVLLGLLLYPRPYAARAGGFTSSSPGKSGPRGTIPVGFRALME